MRVTLVNKELTSHLTTRADGSHATLPNTFYKINIICKIIKILDYDW